MIATSTVRLGVLSARSSFIARSALMPGTWSVDSSSSCQFFGASASATGGTIVDAGAGRETAGAGCVVGVGLGTVVATVAGVPHAASVNDDRSATRDSGLTKNVDFMRDLT